MENYHYVYIPWIHQNLKCLCVCLCVCVQRKWEFVGQDYSSNAWPSYLYFVLRMRDNKWAHSRNSSWSRRSQGAVWRRPHETSAYQIHHRHKVVLFPEPTNPSVDRFQYHTGKPEGLVTLSCFCVWMEYAIMISYMWINGNLDLTHGLALFVLIRCIPTLALCSSSILTVSQ